ncbi:MAG: ABC transporter ATP-binding protein [Burkholderiales bacterium]|nr:ABC transporter ATP-binding protein [Burkholderiales bacterium]
MQRFETIKLLLLLKNHVSPKRRKEFIITFCLMVVSSFADMVSLGALLPFIGLLLAPEKIFNNPLVHRLVTIVGIHQAEQLIIPFTIVFIVISLLSGFIRTLYAWISNRLIFISGSDISIKLYKRMLYQPYINHLSQNSSEVINNISNKVLIIITGVIQPLILMCGSFVLLLFLMILLFSVNFKLSLGIFVVFGFCYIFIAQIFKRQLRLNGQIIAKEQTKVIKALQEGLGGIRDVVLDNLQQIYCEVYRAADLRFRYALGNNSFIAQTPRFLIETLIMILVAIVANILSHKPGGLTLYIPLLGAFAIGAQRIIPALQQIFTSWSNILGSKASLIDVVTILEQPFSAAQSRQEINPLKFTQSIQLVDGKFRYNDKSAWILNGMNFTIKKGSKVGFVGNTGSGKTTTLDILMGLLTLNQGQLVVDGVEINLNNVINWQKNIAHVPQNIFLTDASFAENIAFGIDKEDIDMQRVQLAAKMAHIDSFIVTKELQYQESVGERGARLSGGQKQRIGIARALYKNANILIFDEATSALDNSTEKAIMEEIIKLNSEYTILIIAHRLNTIRHCDTIIEIEEGRVKAQGTYVELIEKSESFKRAVVELNV